MPEKKIQENPNPMPEEPTSGTLEKPKETNPVDKPSEMTIKSDKTISDIPAKIEKAASDMPVKFDKAVTDLPAKMDKTAPAPTHKPVPTPIHSPRFTVPSFTKTSPNDLYRKLLPAVLFVLTFVTVMTVLLIYMDTVALGAQQFRVNMSRDYELARIPQSSPPLVAYVRQLHLAPPPARGPQPPPARTKQLAVLDNLYGEIYNGTFVEFLPGGPRSQSTLYLEAARQWSGVAVRAAARDYLALRSHARAAHACLSPTQHPREVSYSESESASSAFRSRVLCLPLYTLLLAAEATRADYLLLAGPAALPALTHVPYDEVHIQVIELRSSDLAYRNKTTAFLTTKNYTVAAEFDDCIMYALND